MVNLQIAAVAIFSISSLAQGAALIERDGRFEWNWSTGNVRYYGTSLSDTSDGKTWRPAEQRAWSEGLTHGEKNLPQVIAQRIGSGDAQVPQKFSKLLSATRSVNTTYYGDNRIKVTLETPIAAAVKQLSGGGRSEEMSAGSSPGGVVVIKVPKTTNPSIAFSVIDETGKELVSAKQMIASIVGGSAAPRWFKTSANAPDVPAVSEKTSELKASSTSKGVLKVQSGDWRPEYASLVTTGHAAVVVQ